jgi:hypothetical protein
MNKETIIRYMNDLAQLRPVFHSEADFQHELACVLKQHGHSIRLEKPFVIEGPDIPNGIVRSELDIEVDGKTAIELKFKTTEATIAHQEEHFELKSHGAQNLGRFDILDDARKLNWLKSRGNSGIQKGFAIFLTNDPLYLSNANGNLSGEFSLHQGRVFENGSSLNWVGNPGANSVDKKRLPPFAPLEIRFNEVVEWQEYSDCTVYMLEPGNFGKFSFFVLEV